MAKRKAIARHLYQQTEPYTRFSPLYEPLGAFTVAFGHLESSMTTALVQLLRITPQQAFALEDLMPNLNNRIELFDLLCQKHFTAPKLKSVAKQTARRLRTVNNDRNNLLHGPWQNFYPAKAPTKFGKPRRKVTMGAFKAIPMQDVTPTLIRQEVDYLIRLDWLLSVLRAYIHDETRFDPAEPFPSLDKLPKLSPVSQLLDRNRAKASRKQPSPSRA